MEISRRNFLTTGIAEALLTILPPTPALANKNIVAAFKVPDNARPIGNGDIDQIVKALESSKQVGISDYAPLFIDLVQHNFMERNGSTYLNASTRLSDTSVKNPARLELVNGLGQQYGILGLVVHNTGRGEPHIVSIDASLPAPTFLHVLNHELDHLANGVGEFRAIANTHRDICDIVAKYPRLITKNPAHCPLSDLMRYYISSAIPQSQKQPISFSHPFLGYLQLLASTLSDNRKVDIGMAAFPLMDFNVARQIEGQVTSNANKGILREGNAYIQSLIANFSQQTYNYIVQKNPALPPEAKLALMKSMLDFSKAYQPRK